MDFEKLKKERIEYNEKLIQILNIIIQRYPSMRLGQILYTFGFTTKQNKIFDTFNEEPKITYQRVIEQTKTNAELYNLIIDNIVTDESLDKIKNILNNEPSIASKDFEEKVTNKMLDILRNDNKFQDFSKQCMIDIISGKI